MKKIILSLVLCLGVLIAIESVLRVSLFEFVSYSSSESIDRQITDRNVSDNWNILFVGDSETRWGINPAEIDRVFASHTVKTQSFNHAFDGFGASWWPQLLPGLLRHPALQNVEVVAVGIQLISSHRLIRNSGEDCGALQRPVLTSSFGSDLGLNGLCAGEADWDAKLAQELFDGLALVRYSSAVRSLVMPSFMNSANTQQLRFNSAKSGSPINGYVPHKSIASNLANYQDEFDRWKKQYVPERDFKAMDPKIWRELTSSGGFFDNLHSAVSQTGKKLVLFALPTNPTLIDTWNRRADYTINAALLKRWSEKNKVVFVDAGIRDVAKPNVYFSDMRHLSYVGADQYSAVLAKLLVEAGVVIARP